MSINSGEASTLDSASPSLPPCPDEHPTHHQQVATNRGFTVDIDLKPTLDALWGTGVITLCSCAGETGVRHRLFGATHDHYGFIAFPTLDDATQAFALLERRQANPALTVSPEGHHGATEYTVEFEPVARWNAPAKKQGSRALSIASHTALFLTVTALKGLVFMFAILGFAYVLEGLA